MVANCEGHSRDATPHHTPSTRSCGLPSRTPTFLNHASWLYRPQQVSHSLHTESPLSSVSDALVTTTICRTERDRRSQPTTSKFAVCVLTLPGQPAPQPSNTCNKMFWPADTHKFPKKASQVEICCWPWKK
ncbi:hypothetical protein BaRGS_00010419 [Batillaria attramentaria]|uniref:Uncharacterized protein n=1 Tax=Batillaria attramentaria TaxID=370345 RepID=A0ABD0LGB8_9CAEN